MVCAKTLAEVIVVCGIGAGLAERTTQLSLTQYLMHLQKTWKTYFQSGQASLCASCSTLQQAKTTNS
jgi:hypothetical protein